jgi:hypothetical protein
MENWIFNYNSDNFDFGGGEEFIEVANFAALPVTGESGVIYVTLDTNKLYRWTGSTYVEISASVSPVWGGITGSLINQTDLQNALNLKQNSLGYTPENVTNKATNLTSPDNSKYPTTLAVSDALAGKQNTLANPVTGTGENGQVAFWNGTNSQTGDNNLFWDNTNKRLGIGATPATTVRLDVRAQGALSTDIAFRVRNSANTADFLSVNGNGNIIVGLGQAQPTSSTLQVFSGFGGGNRLELICDTTTFSAYHGISFISTGRPGFFSLQSQGTQDTFNRVRFTSGGNEANAKISAYIYQTNTDRQGHWHFRTQVHLGNADRAYNNNYGLQTLVIENATAPSATPTDGFVQYSADITAGNAAPHFRTENGNVIKLYRETTGIAAGDFVANTSAIVNDTATYGGYTMGQVVAALKAQGLLA